MSDGPPRLAPYAVTEAVGGARRHAEPGPALRGAWQRDRDRVVHSAAFRRLEYKTQVFVNHEGDMFRTRLTHSMEVAQVARTIARTLGLNEDLTEAIALAHDLGHTPFGHAGQDALNECMRAHGGFEHNLQSLRVVDQLEERYADFDGLNLTFETREGIIKHCSRENAAALGDVGRRFLEGGQASLEAQIANLADEIAYNCHDVDDGLRAGLLDVEGLREVSSFREPHTEVTTRWPGLHRRRVVHEVVRRMINRQVTDLVQASRDALEAAAPADLQAVRAAPARLIGFSEAGMQRQLELKRFLRTRLYRHFRVHRMSVKAGRIVRDLFAAFMDDARVLPDEVRERAGRAQAEGGEGAQARVVADYIAGMTDRFAILEHRRVFDPAEIT